MTNPVQARTVELAATTENIPSGDVVFTVSWIRDHNEWHGRLQKTESFVDPRRIPAPAFPIRTQVAGSRTALDWPVTWPATAVTNNNDIEVYAVIRAEYRFIKDNGWTKLAAKAAAQGIDSLFMKGGGKKIKYALVESKCTRKTDEYDGYVSGASPLGNLGRPTGELVGGQPMSANGIRQMSRPWITHAFLQESGGNPNGAVRQNLRGLRRWMCMRRRLPLRFLNVYGPPRIGGTPHFYLIAGEYAVRCRVEALNQPQQAPNNPADQGNDAISGPIRVNWGDEPYRPMEFFSLDARTTKSPGISGDFHDYSAQFRTQCARDRVNPNLAAAGETEANGVFAS